MLKVLSPRPDVNGERREPVKARDRACACLLAALFLAEAEAAAWLVLVPATVMPMTFLCLNGLVVCMFIIGFASAANGLPSPSVTQVLHDAETTTPAR